VAVFAHFHQGERSRDQHGDDTGHALQGA